MTEDAPFTGPLHQVRLVGLPLDLLDRAQKNSADLMREFALIDNPHPDSQQDVPARLLGIVHMLRHRFSGFTEGPDAKMRAARARGDKTLDVVFELPVEAAAAATQLDGLLDEAEEYCRRGELLTLATPDDLVALRRWYLGEFNAQLSGAPPTPWDDARQREGLQREQSKGEREGLQREQSE